MTSTANSGWEVKKFCLGCGVEGDYHKADCRGTGHYYTQSITAGVHIEEGDAVVEPTQDYNLHELQ